ncbi:TPA: gp53-like domain-containing protein [Yersinia enterocolitica]
MSKIERYAGNLRAFGSNAQGLERTLFGETTQADDLTSQVTNSFLRGWGIVGPSENPSMEDFNAAMYTMSQFIAYQHQMGIPEWDAIQEYYSGSICVRNGEAYLSLVDSNIGSAPPSAKWTSVLTAKNALANISGFLKSSNNLSEIKDAGPAAVAQTLLNLGLGDAAKRGVGKSANQIPDISYFLANLGFSGHQDVPSLDVAGNFGLRWGTMSAMTAGPGQTVTFTRPFSSNCVFAIAFLIRPGSTNTGTSETMYLVSKSATQATFSKGGSESYSAIYLALGY